MYFIDPAERTLENFEEILHKAREKMDKEAAASKAAAANSTGTAPPSRTSSSSSNKFSRQDREEAAKIIRLLSIALQEEEEEEEEERREHHGLLGGLPSFRGNHNTNNTHDSTTPSHLDEESANKNAVELFTKNPKRNYVAVHPMEIIGDDYHQP